MIVDYLPKGSPRRKGKDDLLVSKYYFSFTNLKTAITDYYRTKRFKLNIAKHLFRDASRRINVS